MKWLFSLFLTILFFLAGVPFFKDYLSTNSLFFDDGKLSFIEFLYFILFFIGINFLAALSVHALFHRKLKVKDVSFKIFEDDEVKQVPVEFVDSDKNTLANNKNLMSEIIGDVGNNQQDTSASVEDQIRKKHHN